MSSTWGNKLRLSLFGESHSAAIGIVLDGLPAGTALDLDEIAREMERRAPGRSTLSTARREADRPELVSGFFNGRTTGTPLCAVLYNGDTKSGDYDELRAKMRPGHADYAGRVRYQGFNDVRGGGHFSGRLTAPVVFAGAVTKQLLAARGVTVGAHIRSLAGVEDEPFDPCGVDAETLHGLGEKAFPVLDEAKGEAMREEIARAKKALDSVGGVVEGAAVGLPAGVGDPFFDSVESTLAALLFSVPAVKAVEFGAGFGVAAMRGSACNDEMTYDGGRVRCRTNHNGGLTGGITNGMPLVFRAAVKPTSSIAREQRTVDVEKGEDTVLSVHGRHDPCIVPRAVPVVEAVTALALWERWPDGREGF